MTSQDDSELTGSAPDGGSAPGLTNVAGTDVPPPSASVTRTTRAHRFLVSMLLVLATIITVPAAFAVWINRQALNTANWSSTSGKILENRQVQTALSAYLVNDLFHNVNVSAVSPLPAALVIVSGIEPERNGAVGRVQTLDPLAALKDRGAITSDEYQAEKTAVMNTGT